MSFHRSPPMRMCPLYARPQCSACLYAVGPLPFLVCVAAPPSRDCALWAAFLPRRILRVRWGPPPLPTVGVYPPRVSGTRFAFPLRVVAPRCASCAPWPPSPVTYGVMPRESKKILTPRSCAVFVLSLPRHLPRRSKRGLNLMAPARTAPLRARCCGARGEHNPASGGPRSRLFKGSLHRLSQCLQGADLQHPDRPLGPAHASGGLRNGEICNETITEHVALRGWQGAKQDI